jgi:hypothetical protein
VTADDVATIGWLLMFAGSALIVAVLAASWRRR